MCPCCKQDTWQLRQIFGDLEEGNLFLIQTSQVKAYLHDGEHLETSHVDIAWTWTLNLDMWDTSDARRPLLEPRCHCEGSRCS